MNGSDLAAIKRLINSVGEWTKTHKYHYHHKRMLNVLVELEEMEENMERFGEIQDPSKDLLIENGESY